MRKLTFDATITIRTKFKEQTVFAQQLRETENKFNIFNRIPLRSVDVDAHMKRYSVGMPSQLDRIILRRV